MAEKIQFEVTLENGQLKTKLKDTRNEFDETTKSTEKTTSKLAAMGSVAKAGMALVGVAMVGLGKKAVELAGKFEKTSVAFETMLGGGKKGKQAAEKLVKDIQKFSAKTPLAFDDLAQGSKRLLAFGTGLNEIIPTMQMLGDISQGNAATLDRLTLAYGKVQSRGKASMEELNQISEAGVPIIKELSDNLGVTKEELFKMVSQGKVSFGDMQQAIKDMTSEGGQFHGMMEKMSSTLEGKWSTLKDTIALSVTEVGMEMLPKMKELLDVLIESENLIPGIIRALGTALGIFANVIAQVVKGLDLLFSKAEFEDVSQELDQQKQIIKTLEAKRAQFKKGTQDYKDYSALIEESNKEVKKLQIGNLRYQKKHNEQIISDRMSAMRDLQEVRKRFMKGESPMGYSEESVNRGIKAVEEKVLALKKENREYDRQISKLQAIENVTIGIKTGKPSKGGGGKTAPKKTKGAPKKDESVLGGLFGAGTASQLANTYLSTIGSTISQAQGLWDQYYSQQEARIDSTLEKRINAIQTWYLEEKDLLLNSQMDHESRELALAQLETEKEKREQAANQKAQKDKAKMQRDSFKKQQALGIANVWIAAAQGVMQGFAQLGPIGGAIMAAVTLGMAAAQTALISSQKPPALATGTTNVPADMLAQLHAGEGVIPKPFMEGVRSGELTLGEGTGAGTTYNVTVEGNIATETEFFNRLDEMRNERAQTLGGNNYATV